MSTTEGAGAVVFCCIAQRSYCCIPRNAKSPPLGGWRANLRRCRILADDAAGSLRASAPREHRRK
jgi:hypothetical protein